MFRLTVLTMFLSGWVRPDLIQIPITQHMTLYRTDGPVITYVVCNRAMAKPLIKAVQCLERLERPVELVFHGCYNYRNIAGTDRPSKHATGMAIDLNAGIEIPDRMVKCFEDAGFTWGGRWGPPTTDPMHFQIDRKLPNG